MKYKTLLFDIQGSVAKLTLNRPEVKNAINLDMTKELMDAALRCMQDSTIRAVLITGSGAMFCPGGDIKAFIGEGKNMTYYMREMTTYLHTGLSYLTHMDAPVVAAVNGAAAGAGMSLALASDIVIAATSARFTMAYTRIGLTPDGGSTYFLSRAVGLKRALELVLTNRELSAQEAFDLGIVTRVVPDSELLVQAEAIATQLAAGATKALGASKRLLHRGWVETLETQMENESQTIADIASTPDAQEATAAFLEKRKPEFRG